MILRGVIEMTFCSKTAPSPRNWHKKTRNCLVQSPLQKDKFIVKKRTLISGELRSHILFTARLTWGFFEICLVDFWKNSNICIKKYSKLSWMNKAISRFFWCQFREVGVVLEQKVSPMTPIKIKSYLLGTISRPFNRVLSPKKAKRAFFLGHPVHI